MALVNNKPFNTRILEDVSFIKSASLQDAVVTAGLDFVQAMPYPTTEQVIAQANLSATTTTLAGGITASIAWEESADNSTFAAVPELAGFTVLGKIDLAATSQQVLLPPSVKRYVRLAGTFTDAAGDPATNYTGSITASVLF